MTTAQTVSKVRLTCGPCRPHRAFEHTAAGRWEPLIEVYLARLEATEETSARSDLLRRIARVFEKHLNDENQAFDALVTALRLRRRGFAPFRSVPIRRARNWGLRGHLRLSRVVTRDL